MSPTGPAETASPIGRPQIVERLAAQPEAVRAALARVLTGLESAGLHPEDRVETELVLAELLNNIVEHAYSARSEGWIRLELVLHPTALHCRVEDAGGPLPDLTPPDGRLPDTDVPMQELPEGGWGWLLIRSLTHGLAYSRSEGRNCTSFEMRRRPAANA